MLASGPEIFAESFIPMKKCVYCGLENADDAVMCTTCHTQFVPSPAGLPAAVRNDYVISPEEWRFWNRMTFRQFAVVILRLAALWCFFEAALEGTLFVRYMMLLPYYISTPLMSTPRYSYAMSFELITPALRVGLCTVAGFFLYFRGERVLSWLVSSAVQRLPPEISPATPISEKYQK